MKNRLPSRIGLKLATSNGEIPGRDSCSKQVGPGDALTSRGRDPAWFRQAVQYLLSHMWPVVTGSVFFRRPTDESVGR